MTPFTWTFLSRDCRSSELPGVPVLPPHAGIFGHRVLRDPRVRGEDDQDRVVDVRSRERGFLIVSLLLLFALPPGSLCADPVTQGLSDERPPAGPTDAQPEDVPVQTAAVTLDDIIVQAEREGPAPTDTSLSRIDRREVAGSVSKSVSDALEMDPSVFTFSNARGEKGISFRGFDQRQVLLLMDGVPLYNAYDRVLDLGKIPMGPIDHITLVKGAGSIAYGPNGLGGAINITTRRPGEGPLFEGEFASSPEDEAYRFRLGSDLQVKSLGCHLDFGGAIEDGYHLSDRFTPTPNEDGGRRNNSSTENYYVSGKIAWDLSSSHQFRAGGFFLRGDWDVPPDVYAANPRYWKWKPWKDVNAHVGHAGRYGAFSMEEILYMNLNTNELDSYDDSSYRTQNTDMAFHSRHEDSTFGVTLRPSFVLDPLPLPGKATARAWVGARYDRHEERPDRDEPESTFSVYTLALAPEIELAPWEKLALIAGLQADVEIPEEIERFNPASTSHVGPMFQVFYRPKDPVFLKLQATRRARFPTLKERYSSTLGGRLPNPQLEPEKAWNLGLDAGYGQGAVRITAGVFYSDVTDLIEETVLPGGDQQMDNLGGVRYLGAETLLEWSLGWGLLLRADYAFLHYEREDPGEGRLPYRPAHKGSAGLAYAWKDWLEASTLVRAVSGQDFQDPDTGRWGRLGAHSSWDAFLRVRPVRNLSLWLNVVNLLDADYQNAYGFPEPGRTFWIGLRGRVG